MEIYAVQGSKCKEIHYFGGYSLHFKENLDGKIHTEQPDHTGRIQDAL